MKSRIGSPFKAPGTYCCSGGGASVAMKGGNRSFKNCLSRCHRNRDMGGADTEEVARQAFGWRERVDGAAPIAGVAGIVIELIVGKIVFVGHRPAAPLTDYAPSDDATKDTKRDKQPATSPRLIEGNPLDVLRKRKPKTKPADQEANTARYRRYGEKPKSPTQNLMFHRTLPYRNQTPAAITTIRTMFATHTQRDWRMWSMAKAECSRIFFRSSSVM